MTYLQWKQINLLGKQFEVVSQDNNFAYLLKSNDGRISVSGFGINQSVAIKWLSLAIRARDEVQYHFVPMPRILIMAQADTTKNSTDIDTLILKKDSYFRNRLWSNDKPKDLLIAIEEWLSDYGYLNVQLNSKEEGNNASTFNFFK